MTKSKIALLFSGLIAATMPLGCSADMVSVAKTVPLANPMTMFNIGNGGGTISMGIDNIGKAFATQAYLAATSTDLQFYEIQLIPNIPGPSPTDNYSDGSVFPVGPTLYLDGPATGTAVGATVDAGVAGKVQFTSVPPLAGGYRIRIKASNNPTAAAIGLQKMNKDDEYFSNASGWEISQNYATVAIGASTVYSAGSELDVQVRLLDAKNDDLPVQITVTPGNSTAPSIAASDI